MYFIYTYLQSIDFCMQFYSVKFFRFDASHAVTDFPDRFQSFAVNRQIAKAFLDLVKAVCHGAW